MTLGVANVRNYFYRGSLIDPPTGWLFNKKSGLLIFFESYKKSVSNNLKVYTHLFMQMNYVNQLKLKIQDFILLNVLVKHGMN